jgi:glycerophosphoryl diester phosphodiesterase
MEDIHMINYAHRGASEYAPENTMASFFLGLELGANGIETDIRETADGMLVLFHDESTLRITGENVKIDEAIYHELYSMDMGSYKDEKYKNEKIVLLEDFLRYFSAKEIELAIELKAPAIEKKVLELIYKYDCLDRTTITSFKFEYLINVRNLDKKIRLGFLTDEYGKDIINKLINHKINQYCPLVDVLTNSMVNQARDAGLTVRVWGVKTIELMEKAIKCGVDGMTVNFPDKLFKAMNSTNW